MALLARGIERLEAARDAIVAAGGAALAIPVDVAEARGVEEAAETVERELGPIDVWVNNAMVSVFSPVSRMRPEEYRRVTEVTYLGAVHGTLAALARMRPRDRGVIVQVGSALAYRAIPLQSAYCAAKHALQGFSESLRTELLHEGSRVAVTMVQLPALNTPQFDWVRSRLAHRAQPVPPIYQPEVAARAIVWASRHPRRRDLVVGWPTWVAIWGNRLARGLADRYLARHGFASQQTAEREDPDRPDNLFLPAPGTQGAHGRFDTRAHPTSAQLWATEHRTLLGALAAVAALAWLRWPGRRAVRR